MRHRRRLHARSRPRARSASTANTSSTRRAKTSSPASARPRRSPIRREGRSASRKTSRSKRRCLKSIAQLIAVAERLETHYRDMQDIEFTVEQGTLYMLQTRIGQTHRPRRPQTRRRDVQGKAHHRRKRPSCASTRPSSTSSSTPPSRRTPCAMSSCKGLPASPGRRRRPGRVRAGRSRRRSRPRASPSSSCASRPAPKTSRACTPRKAIVTARGGMTSHAAVVARGMGRPCVCGAGSLQIDAEARHCPRRLPHAQEGRHHHGRRRQGRSPRRLREDGRARSWAATSAS